MACHYAAVQNGHRHAFAGGNAPGGVAVHGVVHVLIVIGRGILQERVRVFRAVQPAAPGLGLGNIRREQGNARILRRLRLLRRQQGDMIGVCRREPVGFLGGGQSIRHGNALKSQRTHALLPGKQLRREGGGVNLRGFLALRPHQQNVLLVLLPFRQGGGLLSHLMGNHVRLVRPLLLAEDIVLRQTGQAVGKRFRFRLGGGLRNRLAGGFRNGFRRGLRNRLAGGFGNGLLRRGSLHRRFRLGFPGGLRGRRFRCGFGNGGRGRGLHRLRDGLGRLGSLLRQGGQGQRADHQRRRQ